jgi:hypothetical protein
MNSTEFFSNSNPAIGIIRHYLFLQDTKFEASLLQTHMYTLTLEVNQNLGQMMSIEISNKEHGFSHYHHIRHCNSVQHTVFSIANKNELSNESLCKS